VQPWLPDAIAIPRPAPRLKAKRKTAPEARDLSAGGTLTLVTALALRDRPAAAPVILQFAMYPQADSDGKMRGDYPSVQAFSDGYSLHSSEMRFYQQAYNPAPGHWRGSPLVADLTGAPPILLVTAALDPLRDQGRAYAAKAIGAGVSTTYREVAGTIHGFAGYRRVIPSAQIDFVAVLEIAAAMIRESLASTGIVSPIG